MKLKQNTATFFIRPPGTIVPDGLMFYSWFFLISSRNLQAPAADRRETLPQYDRYLTEFYNASPQN